MYSGGLVFSQLMDFLPMHQFGRCANRYNDNHYIKHFSCLDRFLCMAFFVIRSKTNTRMRCLCSHDIDKSTGLRCDQTIVLTGVQSKKDYPDKLRRVKFFDKKNTGVFLSSQIISSFHL